MNDNDTKEIKIVTHSASFHADDVFAVATLLMMLGEAEQKANSSEQVIKVIRSRHPDEIATGDYVVDVGGEYDPACNRFDHHQKGGAGKRDNGVPYASFGLVWKHFGKQVCGDDEALWQKIENELVCAIDANDNGFDISKNLIEGVFSAPVWLFAMIEKPTWEEKGNEALMNERFTVAVSKAKAFLERYIIVQRASLDAAREITETYNASNNKSLIIFAKDYERINFIHTLSALPEIKFFVYPNNGGTWSAETVPISESSFEKRKSFPEAWAGLSDSELANVSGVPDATFCHNGRFLAFAKTQEGAINLAKIALES